jgi:DNA-binding LacI/PurR family transcriptional regulator
MKRTTLKEVADECGVSLMTVSRALDPRHHNRMRPETRKRILQVVKKLNYVSDPAARRLKRRKTDVITLIVGRRFLSSPEVLDFNPHFDDLSWGTVRGAIQEARKFNYELKIEAILNDDDYDQIVSHMQPHLTDGVILIVGCSNPQIYEHLEQQRLPYISAKFAEGETPPGNVVTIERKYARIEAYKHIVESGRKKIAYIGSDKLFSSRCILTSFKDFYSDKGLYDDDLIYDVSDLFKLRELFSGFNGKPPFDALFCCNDTMADYAIREMRHMGIRVPEDVAVIGQDGNSVYMRPDRTNPATILCPWSELTATCVAELVKLIEVDSDSKIEKSIPASFIKGHTV